MLWDVTAGSSLSAKSSSIVPYKEFPFSYGSNRHTVPGLPYVNRVYAVIATPVR